MNLKQIVASLAGGVLAITLATTAERAHAQGPDFGPSNERPAVSPYLNLLDQGYALAGLSPYQTLVRPLVEQNEMANQQQAQIQQLQRSQRAASGYGGLRGTGGAVRSTGHSTRFFNYSHYYALRASNAR